MEFTAYEKLVVSGAISESILMEQRKLVLRGKIENPERRELKQAESSMRIDQLKSLRIKVREIQNQVTKDKKVWATN